MNETLKTIQVNADFYKRLCEVVHDGTFVSIDFTPWHKGCDTCLDATCDWPELQDEMEEWYYENAGEFEIHTTLNLIPKFTDNQLIFNIYTEWNRSYDQFTELSKEWYEESIQDFVFDLLPQAIKEQIPPEDLWISFNLEYEEPGEVSVTQFSISAMGKERKDLAAALSPENLEAIGKYVLEWCQKNHGPQDNFSISIENNEVRSVVSVGESVSILVVPKKGKA
jgi:hypothetical protein